METKRLWMAGAVLATVLTVPVHADTNPRQVAEAAMSQWNEAMQHGRIEDIVALYSHNALLLAPDGKVSHSPTEIRDFWRLLMTSDKTGQNGAYSLNVVEARSEDDSTVVTKTVLARQQTLPNENRHVLTYTYGEPLYSVLKRQKDGSWLTTVQRWN